MFSKIPQTDNSMIPILFQVPGAGSNFKKKIRYLPNTSLEYIIIMMMMIMEGRRDIITILFRPNVGRDE